MVIGYALTCKMRLPAVANTIEEARYQARKHNRSNILATDIRAALFDYQIPSDQALQQAFEPVKKGQMRAAQTMPDSSFATAMQSQRRRIEWRLQGPIEGSNPLDSIAPPYADRLP
jgi:hypothetical protein